MVYVLLDGFSIRHSKLMVLEWPSPDSISRIFKVVGI